jgi:hypothetical protein
VIPVLIVGTLGFDVWNTLEAREQTKEATATEQVLEASAAELRQRHEAKSALIDDLIAGRVTLAEVAEQFMILNRGRPACMEVIRRTCSGATDEEKMARNVIRFAEASFQDDPNAAAVRTRLEAELAAMFDPHHSPASE